MSKLQAPLRSESSSRNTEMVPLKTAGNEYSRWDLNFLNRARSYDLELTGTCQTRYVLSKT